MLTPKWGRLLLKGQLQVFLLRVSATEVFILAVGRRGEAPRVSAAYVQAKVTPRWALSWRSGLYVIGQRAGGCTGEGRLDLAACPGWKEQRSMQGDLLLPLTQSHFSALESKKAGFLLGGKMMGIWYIYNILSPFLFPLFPCSKQNLLILILIFNLILVYLDFGSHPAALSSHSWLSA